MKEKRHLAVRDQRWRTVRPVGTGAHYRALLSSHLPPPAVGGRHTPLNGRKDPISTTQMVTFLEAGCVHEATPLSVYLQWHLARACHSGAWHLVNCQLRAAQCCGLLDDRKGLVAKGHCLTSCSPGHTGEKPP